MNTVYNILLVILVFAVAFFASAVIFLLFVSKRNPGKASDKNAHPTSEETPGEEKADTADPEQGSMEGKQVYQIITDASHPVRITQEKNGVNFFVPSDVATVDDNLFPNIINDAPFDDKGLNYAICQKIALIAEIDDPAERERLATEVAKAGQIDESQIAILSHLNDDFFDSQEDPRPRKEPGVEKKGENENLDPGKEEPEPRIDNTPPPAQSQPAPPLPDTQSPSPEPEPEPQPSVQEDEEDDEFSREFKF